MSHSYSLRCAKAKLKVGVGQGGDSGMTVFYRGETKTMERLGRFLEITRGEALVLVSSATDDGLCVEFEPDSKELK